MPIIINSVFDADEKPLQIFNGVAVIDQEFAFTTGEDCQCLNGTEEDFTFPNFSSGWFRVYNERLGRRIKNITTLTQSGGSLVMNASELDMTFDTNGRYYYEVGYTQTGGYEFPLRYGPVKVI